MAFIEHKEHILIYIDNGIINHRIQVEEVKCFIYEISFKDMSCYLANQNSGYLQVCGSSLYHKPLVFQLYLSFIYCVNRPDLLVV